MIVHVRNFGKIESADIDLSNFVIFVGENNSGKTYLMQLIYGLFSFFYSQEFNSFLVNYNKILINCDVSEINTEIIRINKLDSSFSKEFENELNLFINERKDSIVETTFHTHNLPIESLRLEISDLSNSYSIIYDGSFETDKDIRKRFSLLINDDLASGVGFGNSVPIEFVNHIVKQNLLSKVFSEFMGLKFETLSRRRDDIPIIYLPASRSGIMLLYANYMAQNEKDKNNNNDEITYEEKNETEAENPYGLTEPVYNFLTFLLMFKNSERASILNKDLISFIDNYIINGELEKIGNTMRYKPSTEEQSIPIYLSSSLVTEMSPIYQVLSGVQRYSYILYDEIETCQHPTKQLQLARLLIRMVNAGYRMIVSTHSDTMAAAINNLIILSYKNNKAELLKTLNFDEADILEEPNVKAYQFLIENGKTNVIEIPRNFSVGFDFSIFNKSNDKIYQDAVALANVE